MRFLALLAVVLLTGCSYFSKAPEDHGCPTTGFVAGADRAFFETAAVTAEYNGFSGACSFKKSGEAHIDLVLPFIGQKKDAKAAQPEALELAYFIAVLSPDETVLQRQAFTTKLAFDKTTGAGTSTEEHTVKIPLASLAEAYKYKVVTGFKLTPEQLKHNKERK